MADPVVEQVVTNQGTTTASTFTLTTTAPIPVGKVVLIAVNKSMASTAVIGVSSITESGAGAVGTWVLAASASRASTHDLSLWAATVTTEIPTGTVFTVTYPASAASNRRIGILAVFSEVTSHLAETASSTNAGGQTNTSFGSNGSASPSSTLANVTNTGTDMLVIGVHTLQGGAVPTAGTGYSIIGQVQTAVGSSDRGLAMQFKIARSVARQSSSMTYAPSTAWAAGVATFPITAEVATPAPAPKVVVGQQEKTVVSRSVIVGGEKKAVASISVIIGGTKKLVGA